MTLINFDGMAIFGPGSEWFWSMLQFLLIAVTLFGIYRQLQAQRSATAAALRTSLLADWNAERLTRIQVAAMQDVAAGRPDLTAAMTEVGNWLENLGDLHRRGLVDSDFAWFAFREDIEGWWATLKGRIAQIREENPTFWVRFEELAVDAASRDQATGTVPILYRDANALRDGMHFHLADLVERLRLEQQLREGRLPEVPPRPASPEDGAERTERLGES